MLPGMVAKYGKDQPVSMKFFTSKAPGSFFHPGELGIITTFDLLVYVNTELACSFRIIEADGAITVTLDKGYLKY